MKKVTKIIIFLLIIIVIIAAGYMIYKTHSTRNKNSISSKIDGYDYVLYDNKPHIYKSLFQKLVTELKKEEIDEKEYATLISKMFLIDFYTLADKTTKNNVGGVQFIYEASKDNFVLEASNTLYKYIENDLNNDRTQNLPQVTDVLIDDANITSISYTYGDKIDNKAYQIKAKIVYKQDLDYPTNIVLVLIHSKAEYNENTITKLEIISVKEGE